MLYHVDRSSEEWAEAKERVYERIIDPMRRFYCAPRHCLDNASTKEHVLDRYVILLGDINEHDLNSVYDEVLRTHTSWTWPLPYQFLNAARNKGIWKRREK